MSGNFRTSHSQQTVQQTHAYEESVPYTAYTTERRSRQVPQTRIVNGQATTIYETEFYDEQVAHTKYRTVTKTYDCQAQRHRQSFDLGLQGQIKFDRPEATYSFSKSEEESWIEHNQNVPAIGLHPSQDRGSLATGEAVIKCRRAAGYPVGLVDPWFKDNFGVTAEEATQLIGKF